MCYLAADDFYCIFERFRAQGIEARKMQHVGFSDLFFIRVMYGVLFQGCGGWKSGWVSCVEMHGWKKEDALVCVVKGCREKTSGTWIWQLIKWWRRYQQFNRKTGQIKVPRLIQGPQLKALVLS